MKKTLKYNQFVENRLNEGLLDWMKSKIKSIKTAKKDAFIKLLVSAMPANVLNMVKAELRKNESYITESIFNKEWLNYTDDDIKKLSPEELEKYQSELAQELSTSVPTIKKELEKTGTEEDNEEQTKYVNSIIKFVNSKGFDVKQNVDTKASIKNLIAKINKMDISDGSKKFLIFSSTVLVILGGLSILGKKLDLDNTTDSNSDDANNSYYEDEDGEDDEVVSDTIKPVKTVYLKANVIAGDTAKVTIPSVKLAPTPLEEGEPSPALTYDKATMKQLIFNSDGYPIKAKGPLGQKVITNINATTRAAEAELKDSLSVIADKGIGELPKTMKLLDNSNKVVIEIGGVPYKIGEIEVGKTPVDNSNVTLMVKIPFKNGTDVIKVDLSPKPDKETGTWMKPEQAAAKQMYGKDFKDLPKEIQKVIKDKTSESRGSTKYVTFNNYAFWVNLKEYEALKDQVVLCDPENSSAKDNPDYIKRLKEFEKK